MWTAELGDSRGAFGVLTVPPPAPASRPGRWQAVSEEGALPGLAFILWMLNVSTWGEELIVLRAGKKSQKQLVVICH